MVSRPQLTPEVAGQHAGYRGHKDEQPEGGTGGHDLLEEVEDSLRQVLGEHPIDEHVHKPQHCIPHTAQQAQLHSMQQDDALAAWMDNLSH